MRPCRPAGSRATSGSRSTSQAPTSVHAISTSTVRTPVNEWVNVPNSMAPGTTLAA